MRKISIFAAAIGLSLMAQAAAASPATNGISLNGINFNGLRTNGLNFNGLRANGFTVNGFSVNGMKINGFTINGLKTNGFTVNGTQPAATRLTVFDVASVTLANGKRIRTR